MSLLEVRNLTVEYSTENGPLRAVDDVDLTVQKGEIFGIVGESGCGKTTLMNAILNLLPKNGNIVNGKIDFDDENLTTVSNDRLREIRWEKLSYIIQNAMSALDPVHQIGSQFVTVIRAHSDCSKQEARNLAADLIESVDIDVNYLDSYPHELSGGQRQRIVIALALALQPSLVIADEPTTGLDVVVQEKILTLIQEITSQIKNSMIIVTHDISVISEIADRVAVMYGGKVMELGPTHEVFKQSAHPYTMGLMNAFPSLAENTAEPVSIPGSPPSLVNPSDGCRFMERCPFATEQCTTNPPFSTVSEDHMARCHYTNKASEFRSESAQSATWEMNANE